jgi:hypothetical protein
LSPDRTYSETRAREHCREAHGYHEVRVRHRGDYTDSTAFLLELPDGTRFGLVVERDGRVELDDIPAERYWHMVATGRLNYAR